MCGATPWCVLLKVEDQGLSPRVRGNRFGWVLFYAQEGPIPACAGQPQSASKAICAQWAYPRVCGATDYPGALELAYKGLSPRVRGNRPLRSGYVCLHGPIPACAGQPAAFR